MTKYLPNPGSSWDNPSSTPLEDVRRAKKLIEEDVGLPFDPLEIPIPDPVKLPDGETMDTVSDDWLRQLGDDAEDKTGFRPTHLLGDGGVREIPPRSSSSGD